MKLRKPRRGDLVKGLLLVSVLLALGGLAFVTQASDEKTVEAPTSIVGEAMKTLVSEAASRREERAQSDPQYGKRVDAALNDGRVNILLYGYGETHEPPLTERAFIGSITVASLDVREQTVSFISLTHDIRAPEIERYLSALGRYNGHAIKIHRAYPLGGFDLMRETVEDATGLSMDFQLAFSDVVIADLVDSVFGGVTVDVPTDFEVTPFYLDGVKYDKRQFTQGQEVMDGKTVIQFIKTVPLAVGGSRYYGSDLEHNARKHLVFKGMLRWMEENSGGPGFYVSLLRFLAERRESGALALDFEPEGILLHNLGNVAGIAKSLVTRAEEPLPEITETLYIVDSAHGDGGVQWVNASQAPAIKREMASGRYPDRALEVPLNANPDGDLVTEYWPSVRALVRHKLLE